LSGSIPVAAIYDGLLRLLCPHALGRKSGRLHAFCYQYGGESHRRPAYGGRTNGEWRCLAVEKTPRQTCIDEVDFDIDAQPKEDPQQGQ